MYTVYIYNVYCIYIYICNHIYIVDICIYIYLCTGIQWYTTWQRNLLLAQTLAMKYKMANCTT